ncbi:C2 domain-containing protein [Babesia ovis]|uniref:C2 domain-containing protein n=1 Tax=Babesia ovis TaxID=5869 RepID=A0A9W5TBC0_BABOV|nr:C2 domain-containing protein [Babesia ovis]
MPRYSVSCTVHEAVLPQQKGGTPVDPLVVMRCFGEERMTSVKTSKTTVACWDESFHWPNFELSPSAWNLGVLEFELQSANAFWRNTTLGLCTLQLRLVCATSDGCYVGRLPLTSPNSVRVIGQLFVTVNVCDSLRLGGGSATHLPDRIPEDLSSLQVPPLLGPQVYKSALLDSPREEYKYYHLYINVYALEHVEVGMFCSAPFITVEYGGCRLQSSKPVRLRCDQYNAPSGDTSYSGNSFGITGLISNFFSGSRGATASNRSNFEFNQCFLVPIRTTVGKPILEDNIVVRIWMGIDFGGNSLPDRVALAPRLLAEGVFSLAKLRARRQAPRWFNFYQSADPRGNLFLYAITPSTDYCFERQTAYPGKTGTLAPSRSIDSTSTVDSIDATSNGGTTSSTRSGATPGSNHSHYIGRILMSASVKRLTKPSDVLVAHVQSSHPLESAMSNPTRLFGDIYSIEARGSFGFEGDFEVMVSISCGPYETRSGWFTAQRRAGNSDAYLEELASLSLGTLPEGQKRSRTGWKLTLNSMTGRLAPIELLASNSPEEQWLVFVRVHGRGIIGGTHEERIIASSSFSFGNIAEHSSKSHPMPHWLPLSCVGSRSTISHSNDTASGYLDPMYLLDTLGSLDPSEMVDHVVSLDPTGLIGTATDILGKGSGVSTDTAGCGVDGTKSCDLNTKAADSFLFPSDARKPSKSGETRLSKRRSNIVSLTTNLTSKDSGHLDSHGADASNKDTHADTREHVEQRHISGAEPTPGDMCDPGATVNVLLTLHTHSFHSDISRGSGMGNDIRTASRPQMVSMLKQDYELRCYIYCARLGTAPHSGVAVMVSCDGAYGRTQIQHNFTRFPVFAECCTFEVTVPTLTSSRLAPPPPITISLLFFDKKRRLLRMESGVTIYNLLVKSASGGEGHSCNKSPAWLHLSGGSSVLIFTELVLLSEAHKASKYELSPLSTKCNITLGLLGLRQLRVPRDYPLDGVFIKLSSQSYGTSVHCEQSFERHYPVGRSKWERGGRLNIDLFTVQEGSFYIPQDPLFDPHVELSCYATSKGKIGPLLGYQSFRCYEGYPLPSETPSATLLDLRHSLNPKKLVQLLHSLSMRSSHDIWFLGNIAGEDGAPLAEGISRIITEFQSSKQYKRLLRSMDPEHIGMHVPPRFVIACDGVASEPGSSLAPTAVSSDPLDATLNDIPFTIEDISPMTPVGYTKHTGGSLPVFNASDLVVLKYFLTIRHLKENVVHRSYPEVLERVATKSSQMQKALRKGLRHNLQKLRFCVVSANNVIPDSDTAGSLFLAVEIGGSESRESLVSEHGAITIEVQRTWEQDLFLPEDGIIRLSVVNSFERLDGTLVDQVMASAQIDLENRWYSKSWQRMLRKDTIPIERILLRDSNNNIQGSLDVIVQIGPVELFSTLRPFSFSKSTHSVTEVRVVVWSTSGVHLATTPADSRTKDQLDLYVVSTLDCQGYRGDHPLSQRTDVHYNCDSGSAQFNWRLVYPEIQSPVGACQLQLSVFDFWKVGPPAFVGEVTLELRQYVSIVSETATRIELSADLPLVNSSSPRPVGTLRVTVQVLTQSESSCSPAGLGRGHPNCKPFLPTPRAGRQWHDWFAHTNLWFDFGILSVYVNSVICLLLLVWLFFIAFIYPALLM